VLVGGAADLGGRGQDVAALGQEVDVAGGQVAGALVRSGEVEVQPPGGGAAIPSRCRATSQASPASCTIAPSDSAARPNRPIRRGASKGAG
jgi:hypothetical protein